MQIINFILVQTIYVLVNHEKHRTKSNHQAALTLKLFAAQFINTAMVQTLVNAGNFLELLHNLSCKKHWYITQMRYQKIVFLC